MTARLEAAGCCATTGEPYPQAAVSTGDEVLFAATGGGGGAAQLLPTALLEPLLAEAWRSARTGALHPDERLTAFFRAADEAMERVVCERDAASGEVRYAGSSAQLVAAVDDAGGLWVGGAGLGRAFRAQPDRLELLTRDDSLLQDFLDGRPGAEAIAAFPHHGIATAMLNGQWRRQRPAWRPVQVTLGAQEGLLLATEAVVASASARELHGWVVEALRASALAPATQALFARSRAASPGRAFFDRTAAVVLVRRAAEGS